jgi:phytoene dehydrogenase-like protein
MPVSSYDLIVIGDEFAGLVAAALCARRGLRVLIVESGTRPSSYQLGPYRLPVEPLAFIGVGSPAVRRVLDELHFQHLIKRKLREHNPSFQFVGPDTRLDLGPDDDALTRELVRELGEDTAAVAAGTSAGAIARLLEPVFSQDIAMPPTGFWERREIGRVAGRLEEEARAWKRGVDELQLSIRPLFSLPAVLGTHAGEPALSPSALSRSFDMWRRGAPRLPGDLATLREMFLEKFASHNGELRTGIPIELTFNWGKVTGVKLDDGEEIGAHHVIAAMPVDELALLAEKKLAKRLRQCVEGMEVAGYRYVLNLVVKESAIPEGMATTVLVVGDPAAPLSGENALAVFVSEPDEARVLVTVEAVCPIPQADRHLDDAFADLRVALRERLEMVMPFFSQHVLAAHSPNEAAPAERLEGEYELPKPVAARPVWRSTLSGMLGISALPYGVGLKNLSMATTQVMPALGLEGEFATGWCAAKIACQSAGKRKDYLKDEVLASPAS